MLTGEVDSLLGGVHRCTVLREMWIAEGGCRAAVCKGSQWLPPRPVAPRSAWRRGQRRGKEGGLGAEDCGVQAGGEAFSYLLTIFPPAPISPPAPFSPPAPISSPSHLALLLLCLGPALPQEAEPRCLSLWLGFDSRNEQIPLGRVCQAEGRHPAALPGIKHPSWCAWQGSHLPAEQCRCVAL